jgi:hypothetical protein
MLAHSDTLCCAQQQQHQETSALKIEYIVLPPNAQAKHVSFASDSVDVEYHKRSYENELCAVLHTPSLYSTAERSNASNYASSGGQGEGGGRQGEGETTQRTMLLCQKLGQMNGEFQVLLSTIDVFCHSADTARNIAAYQRESSKHVQGGSARHKRQRKLHHTRKSEVIPIQLVTGYHARNNCIISATSTSSILVSNDMRGVLPNTCFVDFVRSSAGCPESVRNSMNCVEAREDRNVALGRDASGGPKKKDVGS